MAEPKSNTKGGKAARIQERLFADVPRFVPSKNFSALPWVFRRVLWLFTPRSWQVLTYLIMRCGPEGVTWLTDRQLAVDIDIGHRKIGPQLKELEGLGFIVMREHDGERFICLVDPVPALVALVGAGRIAGELLERLNEDFEKIGVPTLAAGPLLLGEGGDS